jgi:UDP-glucose 4-epimerase
MKILVPGAAGALARQVCARLAVAGHQVIGMDARPWSDVPRGIEFHRVDVRKRAAEDLFRRRRPQVVVHMATINALSNDSSEERYRVNLGGTRAVFEHGSAWGVEHVVFVGRHSYYGAGPDTPLYHTEDEPPQALAAFPELADLVSADLFAANALWRYPKMTTSVLRMVYTLGASGQGTLARFLKGKRVPKIAGFDPLFHFLHEEDAVTAIAAAVEKRPKGVFNVAGPQPLPLTTIARITGRQVIPLPEFLVAGLLGRAGLPNLPVGAIQHIKYPIVVDAKRFREATGFAHRLDEIATLKAFAEAFPVRS